MGPAVRISWSQKGHDTGEGPMTYSETGDESFRSSSKSSLATTTEQSLCDSLPADSQAPSKTAPDFMAGYDSVRSSIDP